MMMMTMMMIGRLSSNIETGSRWELPLLLLLPPPRSYNSSLPASQTRYIGTLCVYSSGSGNLHSGEDKVCQGVRFFYTCLHTLPSTLPCTYVYLLTYFWAFAQSSSSSWTRGARAVVENLEFPFVGCDAIVSARATYLPTLPTSYLTDWSLGIDVCTWVVASTRYVRVHGNSGSDDNRQWRQWRRR